MLMLSTLSITHKIAWYTDSREYSARWVGDGFVFKTLRILFAKKGTPCKCPNDGFVLLQTVHCCTPKESCQSKSRKRQYLWHYGRGGGLRHRPLCIGAASRPRYRGTPGIVIVLRSISSSRWGRVTSQSADHDHRSNWLNEGRGDWSLLGPRLEGGYHINVWYQVIFSLRARVKLDYSTIGEPQTNKQITRRSILLEFSGA